MRVAAAFLPAAVITLALFCLMQYLVTGRSRPVTAPVYAGFVDLIYLKRETTESHTESGSPTIPRQLQPPAETLQLREPQAAEIAPPGLPSLSIPMPETSAVELVGGPHLVPSSPVKIDEAPLNMQPARSVASNTQGSIPDKGSSGNGQPAKMASFGGGEITTGSPGNGSHGNDVIPLLRFDPVYPRKAARAGKEGWVKVEFTVTAEGKVIDAVVVDADPRRIFNSSALKAIRKWQFKPRVIAGKPVQRRATQVIEFTLARR